MDRADMSPNDLLSDLNNWGGKPQMNAAEAVMWHAEVDPRVHSVTTSVFILDREPDWDAFVDAHRWIVNATPRFRQRVVVPVCGMGNPTWVDDPDFCLGYHLRFIRLLTPGSERQLLDLAQTLAKAPFDRTRAPWEATLVLGLDGSRAAYVLKLHHSTSDGMGIIQLLMRVFGKDRDDSDRPQPDRYDSGAARNVTAVELAVRQIGRGFISLPVSAVVLVISVIRLLGTCLCKPNAINQSVKYLSSIKRVLGTKPVSGSELFKQRSLSSRFDVLEISLSQIKEAAKSVDATVNDLYLSALIGGFRLYHERMGTTIKEMPIYFPISIRSEQDPLGGNKFTGSQYAAPVSMADPLKRIRHIQRFVLDLRTEPALDVMIRVMPLVARLPLAAIAALTTSLTVAQDAQISNIPGISHPVYFCGAEVTHFWPFAPVSGCGMIIAMISHNGRCCVGINSDRAAVSDPELLVNCFRQGFQETLNLRNQQSSKAIRQPRRDASLSEGKTVGTSL